MNPMTRKYASTTTVPVSRSRDEIEKTLTRYGANAFAFAQVEDRAMIEFAAHGRRIRFIIPLPDPDSQQFTRTPTGQPRAESAARNAWEQETRRIWRALVLLVKAKLEAVESGVATFETEFLANTVLPSGRTVSDEISPQVDQAYVDGTVTPLQIGPGA